MGLCGVTLASWVDRRRDPEVGMRHGDSRKGPAAVRADGIDGVSPVDHPLRPSWGYGQGLERWRGDRAARVCTEVGVKVVLFCGGQGTRLRDHNDAVPKPMVHIGPRPILWHVMKYYAHYGHTEFILCLGYKSEVIKEYFLNYREWLSNDFVLNGNGHEPRLLSSDIDRWRITFVDTGLDSTIGERLKAIEEHIGDDELFLANYADGLSDVPLLDYHEAFLRGDYVASFVAVHSPQSFHVARVDADGLCTAIEPLSDSEIWINGGFFIFRREIFDYVNPGEDLVFEPFAKLIRTQRLMAYRYEGFWQAMDTFKDRQALEERYQRGDTPWEVWKERTATEALGR
jgi:glucose-1-phosphate cytidylyltransferase